MRVPGTASLGERGASVVEFALIAPLAMLMVMGTLQYGLYFNDALNTRQGVREGARMGVVKTFPACSGAADDWAKLKCTTKAQIGALTGPTYVKVAAPDGWAKGKALVVCAIVESEGGMGLVPMPNDGIITSKTQMSIEKDGAPSGTASADTPPAGASWSWC